MGNSVIFIVLALLGGISTGAAIGYAIRLRIGGKKAKMVEARAKEILNAAQREAETIKKEAELQGKDLLIKLRQDFEKEIKQRREESLLIEKRILQKEENLDKRVDLLEKKEKDITARIDVLHANEEQNKKQSAELKEILEKEKKRLQEIARMTEQEAKNLLLTRLDDELVHEKATRIRKTEEEITDTADKKAKHIISTAIQRCASDYTSNSTVTVVMLPSDEMKGRIIGREGRNIRALEAAAGVDVIIDDTPEAVTISGFDRYRREVAKMALEQLIADGRIHPGRIEEVVEKAKQELDAHIKEEGEKTAFDLGIHEMHPELLKLIGRLKFRTSYGQNALQHTKEVAMLVGTMASMLGFDAQKVIRAGLLHDIGKVIGQDVDDATHAISGANMAKKFGESEDVVNAIAAHHEEVEMKSMFGAIVCAADAISAARPGARAETLETYVKRLESLEKIASEFKGVSKVYALQAGREVRIMVDPDRINDDESVVLARDIRKKIEGEMEYPGQIKVIVLREKRAVEYAK